MKYLYTPFLILLLSFTVYAQTPDPATWMPDANLRTAVRKSLTLADGEALTQAKMLNLTELKAAGRGISNLTGLEHATNVTIVRLAHNQISNLSSLSGLASLTKLRLQDNEITSLSSLSGLTSLTELFLNDNQITDVAPLTKLTKLVRLQLANNSITNAHLLSSLTNLNNVDITIPDPPPLEPPVDVDPPGVTISVPSGVQNGAFDATITFTETVSNFVQADVALSGSAASVTAWSANSDNTVYTATITPTASGTVTIGIAASVATDAANNPNTAAASQTVTVDIDAPTVTIGVPSGTQNGAFDATITFTETVSNFVQADVSLTGSAASITAWSTNSDNTVYTATITPTASGTITVGVAADVATDAANNQNTAATSQTVTVDIDAPTVTIGVPSGTQNSAFDATITFSETVSGFTQSDVSLTGSAASITAWSANSDNTVYTATITPTASGTITVGVAANVATDAANNQNTAATSQTVTVLVQPAQPVAEDTTSPDVTITVPSGTIYGNTFEATITFSEAVSGFEQSDISLSKSWGLFSASSLSANADNAVYTVTVYAWSSGDAVLHIDAGVATDAAENPNTAATSQKVRVDDSGEINFPDTNLAAVIRETLDIAADAPITLWALSKMKTLNASNRQISDLTGLENATALQTLDLSNNQITDVSPLANLTNLKTLRLAENPITNAAVLSGLPENTQIDIDDNNAPVFSDGDSTTRSIAENTASGQNIGTAVGATDADSDTLTYTLSGTDAAAFDIVSTSGQLQTKAALDYETKTSYTVTVSVSDNNSGNDSITVTINVTDVYDPNRAPVFTDGDSTTRSIAENTAANTNIGTAVGATDADSSDTLTYTLDGTDAASFSIVSTSGQLKTKAALDYETKVSYLVTVSVSDGNGGSDSITVTINVSDMDETIPTTPVNERTQQVQDAIVAAIEGVDSANDVTDEHLAEITLLNLSKKGITSLKSGDFSGLPALTSLELTYNSISDISALENLTSLTDLFLGSNSISDISALEDLTSLTRLELYNNSISDISALEDMTSLTNLGLGRNSISNISVLENLTSLTDLELGSNSISDISVLENLTSLTNLGLSFNSISDISVLENLTSLTSLDLYDNSVSDISALEDLTSLTRLELRSNSLSDISALEDLTSLIELKLGVNSISDISALEDMTSLIRLYLYDNSISDISALEDMTSLIELKLHDNSISDVSALENLTSLSRLYLSDNSISDYGPLRTLVAAIEADGRSLDLDITIPDENADSAPASQAAPAKTAVLTNYPNPANPETWIPYQLKKSADVTITIYDVKGVMVRKLKLGQQSAGFYHSRTRAAYWDGKNSVGERVASGVYFYVFKADKYATARKILIRK